ncbi:hypothetical protein [Caballeronia calidae]|nr:hypothetical protein [Caballeronia calidae]
MKRISFSHLKSSLKQEVASFWNHKTRESIPKAKNVSLAEIPYAFKKLNNPERPHKIRTHRLKIAELILNASPNTEIQSAEGFLKALESSCALGQDSIKMILDRFAEVPAEKRSEAIRLIMARFSKEKHPTDESAASRSFDVLYGAILAELISDPNRLPQTDRMTILTAVLEEIGTLDVRARLTPLNAIAKIFRSVRIDLPIFLNALKQTATLDARKRYAPLSRLVESIAFLASQAGRTTAFNYILAQTHDLSDNDRAALLGRLAASIFSLQPVDRTAAFNDVIKYLAPLKTDMLQIPLTGLAHVIFSLPKHNRITAFNDVLAQTYVLEGDSKPPVLWELTDTIHRMEEFYQVVAFNSVLAHTDALNEEARLTLLTELTSIIDRLQELDRSEAFNGVLTKAGALNEDRRQIVLSELAQKIYQLPEEEQMTALSAVAAHAAGLKASAQYNLLKELDQVSNVILERIRPSADEQ